MSLADGGERLGACGVLVPPAMLDDAGEGLVGVDVGDFVIGGVDLATGDVFKGLGGNADKQVAGPTLFQGKQGKPFTIGLSAVADDSPADNLSSWPEDISVISYRAGSEVLGADCHLVGRYSVTGGAEAALTIGELGQKVALM